jgi:hypothetical protein
MPKIYARRKGFLVEIDDIARTQIDETIDWLIAHDFTPDPPAGDPWPKTPSGEPICAKHNAVMVRRQRQGDTWHSHRLIDANGQERYCRGYRNPSSESDGYDV